MAFQPACQTLTVAHVIVCCLLTAKGTGILKHPRNVGASEESKSLEQDSLKVSFVEPILAAKFSYLLFVDIVGIEKKQVATQIFELSTLFVITHCTFVLQGCNFSALRVMQIKEKHFKGKRVFWLIDIYLGREP